MRPRLSHLIFTEAVIALAGIAHAEPRESVHFGLLNIEQEATYGDRRDNVQERTVDYLRKACPEIDFSVEVYDILGLQAAVREGRVDAFLSSSGFFVELWHQGVKDLATLVSNDFPDPNRCVGGSFIVRAEEPQDLTLDDLHGRIAAAPNPQNFMAYQIGMAEIARRGYDPDRFFSRLDFTGNDLPEVLRRVASGDSDVGLVRACILESLLKKMPELRGRLRVVEPVKDAPISCAVSTPLYPGWTVAATTSLKPASAEAIARALLTQPPSGAGGYRWSVATDFKSVNDVFRLLKTGPYA
ncbi:MAG: PhnD/SsuA/transferrin family substrate-binding protein, partial [Sutterella wadsworthensis]|nr:PhnD/SsuA/transferrin family substrate-binding protein [Sutterella wadsworthensis]